MHSFLQNILSDKKGGAIFTLFSPWHFFYILLTIATIAALIFWLRNKNDSKKKKATRVFINTAFALYISDFFLMPLAYGEIDIEKLPFHACTATCVMCFLSCHIDFLKGFKTSFAMLGFISNLVYLIYPAGVMWHAVHPLSYRVVQTLIFHSVMTVYTLLTLVYERQRLDISKSYRDLAVLIAMTVWSLIGNYVYNGSYGNENRFFNWFFVVRDPFYILPENAAPFVMPFLNVVIFFAAEALVYLVFKLVGKSKSSC